MYTEPIDLASGPPFGGKEDKNDGKEAVESRCPDTNQQVAFTDRDNAFTLTVMNLREGEDTLVGISSSEGTRGDTGLQRPFLPRTRLVVVFLAPVLRLVLTLPCPVDFL